MPLRVSCSALNANTGAHATDQFFKAFVVEQVQSLDPPHSMSLLYLDKRLY
jgi:hypothetical protein